MINTINRRVSTAAVMLVAAAGLAAAPVTMAAADEPTHGPTVDEKTLGPDGYKTLRLGMSEKKAVATGLIHDRQDVGECTWYRLKPSEGKQNPGSGVVVSPTEGVVSLPGTEDTHTPEGITMGSIDNDQGSTTGKIEKSYDKYTVDKTGPVPLYTAPAPGNASAHYFFAIGEDDLVKDLGLTSDNDGGCGLNDAG